MNTTAPDSVIGRAAAVLRDLATAGSKGATTTELATTTGLARPTAHRLLSDLQREGFTDRNNRTGRWLLGPELYLLGRQAADRYDVPAPARATVHRLAETTGESAFFSVRRGEETVCLHREDGSFPIRSFVLFEGARFPLGVVSAGLAVLAFLPDHLITDYLARTDLVTSHGPSHSGPMILQRIAATRALGYAVNPGLIVAGSWGMAAAVFDPDDQPIAALTLTGVETRFHTARRPELGALLLREAHRLTTELSRGMRMPPVQP